MKKYKILSQKYKLKKYINLYERDIGDKYHNIQSIIYILKYYEINWTPYIHKYWLSFDKKIFNRELITILLCIKNYKYTKYKEYHIFAFIKDVIKYWALLHKEFYIELIYTS